MDVIPKWSVQDRLLSPALQALISSFALDISTWTILQTMCPNWVHHLSPITVHFPHQWLHLWCFRWPDQSLEGLVFSTSMLYLLFSMSSLDLYLHFYCHHRMLPDYISFGIIGTVPPNIWTWVNFLKHYFIHIFLTVLQRFSFLSNQVQILYLGISSLFIFSLVNTLLLLGPSSYSVT